MCCLYNHKTTISVINMNIQDKFIPFSVVSESFMQSNWSCQDDLTDIKQIKCSGIIYLINFSSSEQIFRMPTVCFFLCMFNINSFFFAFLTGTTHGFITIPHEKPTTTAFHWASLGTPPPPSTQWVTIPWSGVGQAPQK